MNWQTDGLTEAAGHPIICLIVLIKTIIASAPSVKGPIDRQGSAIFMDQNRRTCVTRPSVVCGDVQVGDTFPKQ